ncbi:MAG: hypothetical protein ACYDH9_08245 [Limisphaerales bacterium]
MVTEPPRFIQALQRHGVIESDLRDGTYSSRLRAVWRPAGVSGETPATARETCLRRQARALPI